MGLAAGQVETERLADDFAANAGRHGANRMVQEVPEDLPYNTSEEAAVAAGVFLAANTTTTDGNTT
ncbi:hypothetical protein [Streptomyces sp. NPDC088141]|uniref:hypothetical protein n=1 Tax=unclassified Streptomyces TaxID=2593676 RepID=UPI0034221E0F